MSDRVFIDSNIFLYAFNDDDIAKQQRATDIIMTTLNDNYMSIQVINEVSSNMLRKLAATNDEVQEFVRDSYSRFNVETITQKVFLNACELREQYNLSYYDSLIVSSALEAECTILYSEDMQHNLQIKQLTIINPFKQ